MCTFCLHERAQILENHRDRDGAHAAGDGCEYGGYFLARGIGITLYHAALFGGTGVDECNILFDVFWFDEAGLPCAETYTPR